MATWGFKPRDFVLPSVLLASLLVFPAAGGGLRWTTRTVGGFEVPVPEGWPVNAQVSEAGGPNRWALHAGRPEDVQVLVVGFEGSVPADARGLGAAVWKAVWGEDGPEFRDVGPDAAEAAPPDADVRVGLVVRALPGMTAVVFVVGTTAAYGRFGGLALARKIAGGIRPAGKAPGGGAARDAGWTGRWKTDPAAGAYVFPGAEPGTLGLVTYGGVGDGVEAEFGADGRFRWRVAGTAVWMFMEVVYEGRWRADGDRIVLTVERYRWKPYGDAWQAPPVREVVLRVPGRRDDAAVLEGPCGVGSGTPFLAIFESESEQVSGVCRAGFRRQGS